MVKTIVLLSLLLISGFIASPSAATARAQRCAFDDFIVNAIDVTVTQNLQDLSDSVQDLTQVVHSLRREIKDLKKAMKPDLEIRPSLETTPAPETHETATNPDLPITPSLETTPEAVLHETVCNQNSGYEYSSNIDSYYKLHLVMAPWHLANETCLSEGANLAVVNNLEEAAILADMLKKSHLMYASLGVFKDSVWNIWKTVSGMTLEQAGYEAWGDSEPWEGDVWLYGTLGDDSRLYTGNTVPRPFICEKTLGKHVNGL